METQKVYILDSDQSHTDVFKEFLKKDGYEIIILPDIASSFNIPADIKKLIILVDYQFIVAAARTEVVNFFKMVNNRKVVVYNVPDNADRRSAFYELGASRVYDTSSSLEEVYYSVRWFLSILATKDEDKRLYSKGKLEDIPLTNLINTLAKENRSGVLKIVTKNNSGKIYFFNGDMDDAQVGPHLGEQAVLHMLFWKKGTFSFTSTQQKEPINKIKLSNIGLLLLAESFRETYIANLKELGTMDTIIRVKNSGDLLTSDLAIDEKFVNMIERPHQIEDILENPYYTCYEAAEKLLQLARNQFLIINEPTTSVLEEPVSESDVTSSGLDEIILNKDEILHLKKQLNMQDEKTGKVIVLGSRSASKTEFIRQLTKSKSAIRSEHDVEVAQVHLGPDLDLLLFGLTMNQVVIETTEKLSQGLVGYVFIIDSMESGQFEYSNYIINHLLSMYPVSSVIAVTNPSSEEEIDLIRSKFRLPDSLKWINYKPGDIQSIRNVLLALQPVQESQEEKPAGKEEAEE